MNAPGRLLAGRFDRERVEQAGQLNGNPDRF